MTTYPHKANVEFFGGVSPCEVAPDIHVIVTDYPGYYISRTYPLCPLGSYKPTTHLRSFNKLVMPMYKHVTNLKKYVFYF